MSAHRVVPKDSWPAVAVRQHQISNEFLDHIDAGRLVLAKGLSFADRLQVQACINAAKKTDADRFCNPDDAEGSE